MHPIDISTSEVNLTILVEKKMSCTQPHVEVVLLNWNSYDDTADCIRSLDEVKYENLEITVVDNASSDDSLGKLRSDFPNLKYIEMKENRGFSAGNNIGVRHALSGGTNYVLLLNNDTIVEPDFLTPLIETAEQNPDVGIVTGKILIAGTNPPRIWCAGGEIDHWRGKGVYRAHQGADRGEIDEEQYDKNERVGMASGCMMLIPADVFDHVGLLSEEYFFGGEEWEFSARVRSNGYDIWYAPESVIFHKVSRSIGQSFDNPWQIYNRERSRLLFQQSQLPASKWLGWYVAHWAFKLSLGLLKQRENAQEHPDLSLNEFLKINLAAEHDHLVSNSIKKNQLAAVERRFGNESPWA